VIKITKSGGSNLMVEDYELEHDDDDLRVLNPSCPWCGRLRPDEEPDECWWSPTECQHACCEDCARSWLDPWTLRASCTLCPACEREDAEKN
jgi:hypothetical protein